MTALAQSSTRQPCLARACPLACSRVPLARRQRTAIRAAAGGSQGDGFTYMELDLPPPLNSNVRKASFIKSSTRVADCPPDRLPEFAFIGRSNVGKSSLINSLTNNDKLAKVSKEPGESSRLQFSRPPVQTAASR